MSGSTQVANEVLREAPVQSKEWFALTTMSRHERFAAHELEGHGIETFFPTFMEVHRWSDRNKKVQVPLFPGYLFIRTDMCPDIRRAVSFSRGVVALISMGGQPIPIPEEQIAALQQVLGQSIPCAPHPFLRIGERVRIRGGSLDGIEGILTRSDGMNRLVLSVDGIQRSLSIHIEGYEIEPIRAD